MSLYTAATRHPQCPTLEPDGDSIMMSDMPPTSYDGLLLGW